MTDQPSVVDRSIATIGGLVVAVVVAIIVSVAGSSDDEGADVAATVTTATVAPSTDAGAVASPADGSCRSTDLVVQVVPTATQEQLDGIEAALRAEEGITSLDYADADAVWQEYVDRVEEIDPRVAPGDIPTEFRVSRDTLWEDATVTSLLSLDGVVGARYGELGYEPGCTPAGPGG